MGAFGTATLVLSNWARRIFSCMENCGSKKSADEAVPRILIRPPNEDAGTDCLKARRYRVDAIVVLGLVAVLAGLALLANELVAVWSTAMKPTKPAPTASNRSRQTEQANPAVRGQDVGKPSPFPAPTRPKAWAEAMAACARPGPRVRRFVEMFEGTPAQRIAQIYVWIAQRWDFHADRERDWLIPAESLLEPGKLRGDCKAVAILLAAASSELGIAHRVIATRGQGAAPGHVQAQLLLCGPREDPTPIVDTMAAVWNQSGLITGDDNADSPLVLTPEGWYFALDGGPSPKRVQGLGPVEVIISSTSRADK